MKIQTLQELVDAMITLVGKEGRVKYWTAGCAYASHSEPVVKWELYHEDYGATLNDETAQEGFNRFEIKWNKQHGETTNNSELAKVGEGPRVKK